MNRDRFEGCLLGLALGDAYGAPHEGGLLERGVWRLIGRTAAGERRTTDDTALSLDLAESLIERPELELDDLAHRFAQSYRFSRGFGPGAAKLLKRIRRGEDWRTANRAIYPEGSFGNGGAMRAPVIGLAFAGRPDALAAAAREQASVTHAHPLAQAGAVLIATATARCLGDDEPLAIFEAAVAAAPHPKLQPREEIARSWLETADAIPAREVRDRLGNGIAAADSCVTALYLGLRFLDVSFEALLAFAIELGGDVDTLGAMAGALWGARNGGSRLPEPLLEHLEDRARLERASHALFERARQLGPG